ncbi:MAG: TrbC/VirB2 family protein [Clostridia bacterium]|nr:TrbC/VirB2 family protein [Clostridia bacterium]
MKIKYKIIITLVLIVFAIIVTSSITNATTLSDLNEPPSDAFKNTGNSIVSILTSIGIVISVVVLAILGFKYMLGSLEERAEYKKTLMPYFIGAMITFGASTLANIIYNFVK